MKFSWFEIAVYSCVLVISACKTAPHRQNYSKASVDYSRKIPTPPETKCSYFCDTIRACASQSGHENLSDLLCSIAKCETGNKCIYQIKSKRGRYKGPFQFSGATWRSQCNRILIQMGMIACMDSKKVFDPCCSATCAAEMISNGGLFNWPGCQKKIMKQTSSSHQYRYPDIHFVTSHSEICFWTL